MTSELDHLRAFRAAAAEPDEQARATARAALLDAIEAAVAPPAAPTRRRFRSPRRRPRRLLAGVGGLALAGVAAVAIALLSGLGGGDVQPQPASAGQLLREAADGAAAQPYVALRPGEYWYVRSEGEAGFGDAILPRTIETWSGERGTREREVVGTQARFFSDAARRRWIEDGRPFAGRTLDSRSGPAREPAGEDPVADELLTPAALQALPTEPQALHTVLADAASRQASALELDAAGAGRLTWAAAARLLTEAAAPTPPALRAALLRVMARLPGAELLGETIDAVGRPGTRVGVTQPGTGRRDELVVDPATGIVLERRIVVLEAIPTSEASPDNVIPAGTAFATTYVASGAVGGDDERP